MTVKRLSKKENTNQKQDDELIDSFISGGGKTIEESSSSSDIENLSRFTIRIPKALVKMIDEKCRENVGKVSRNTWILQAIAEKLKKD